jgi:hypothetical protein
MTMLISNDLKNAQFGFRNDFPLFPVLLVIDMEKCCGRSETPAQIGMQ